MAKKVGTDAQGLGTTRKKSGVTAVRKPMAAHGGLFDGPYTNNGKLFRWGKESAQKKKCRTVPVSLEGEPKASGKTACDGPKQVVGKKVKKIRGQGKKKKYLPGAVAGIVNRNDGKKQGEGKNKNLKTNHLTSCVVRKDRGGQKYKNTGQRDQSSGVKPPEMTRFRPGQKKKQLKKCVNCFDRQPSQP